MDNYSKGKALEGVKILDFSWVIAGPTMTKMLADYGATVVKVENRRYPDTFRTFAPFVGEPDFNRSGAFCAYNSSKYSIELNLKTELGLKIAKRLVQWADVVVENYAPGQIEQFGLGYDEISKIKPDIIMISLSSEGQTGPYAKQPGYGSFLQGMLGFYYMTGNEDEEPIAPYAAFPDLITCWYGAVAVMNALEYRRRTGIGQYIDANQFESGIQFLSPGVINYGIDRTEPPRIGNRCPYAAPHDVFRCQGEDRWCAIAVFDDEEWENFCHAIGDPDWTREARFSTLLGRKQNEDSLNELIERWTINHTAEEVFRLMQEAGVAAGVVETNRDLSGDKYLRERGFFQALESPEMGAITYTRPAFLLSKTPPEMRPAPNLGGDTVYVCKEFLGMTDEEISELADCPQ